MAATERNRFAGRVVQQGADLAELPQFLPVRMRECFLVVKGRFCQVGGSSSEDVAKTAQQWQPRQGRDVAERISGIPQEVLDFQPQCPLQLDATRSVCVKPH